MRSPPAKLCLLVSVLAFFNFAVFAIFGPKQWRSGRFFRQDKGINESAIPNVTAVFYSEYSVDNCPEKSELLIGSVNVSFATAEEYYWNSSGMIPQATNYSSNISSTFLGKYSVINGSAMSMMYVSEPKHCRPVHTVAIIIPFRDRESHLRTLLGHLIPVLQRQLIRYSFFVISQHGDETFNKGRLMNTGFEFAERAGKRFGTKFDCFVFQDVDLLVEDDTLLYRCSDGNVVDHLSTAINKFDYKPICCGMTVGGVLAFKEEQYREVNGFPNSYWGWGGEDDDINKRIHFRKIKVVRPIPQLGRFTMIKHDADKLNPYNTHVRNNIQFALKRYTSDGLSNLDTKIMKVEQYPLFTLVNVNVGKPS